MCAGDDRVTREPRTVDYRATKQKIFRGDLNKSKKGSFDSIYRGITMSVLVFYF